MINSISVYKHTHRRQKQFRTTHPFFNEEFIYYDDGESITFSKPTIDYNGKTRNPSKLEQKKEDAYTFTLVTEIPSGVYTFDEDSNNDQMIIYYN